tara:strand:+ start:1337 stop:1720 length:384 start_codon:yes stop_codon:yes gene_type:complete
MELVKCSNLPGDHWYSILDIRNENRQGFGDQSIIPIANHHAYMFENFSNYLLCVDDDEVIGFIGHVDKDIRLATKRTHQNKGVGKFMLRGFMEKFPEAIAKVKIDNEVSLKLFESFGFKKKYYILER